MPAPSMPMDSEYHGSGLSARAAVQVMTTPAVPQKLGLLDKLRMTARSDERDELIERLAEIEQSVRDYLARVQSEHRRALEVKRDELCSSGRTVEDAVKQAQAEVWRLQNMLAGESERIGDWSMKLRSAKQKPVGSDTRFPTAQERQEWAANLAAIAQEHQIHQRRADDLAQQLQAADVARAQVQKRLDEILQQIEDIDLELSGQARPGPFGLVVPAAGE